MNFEISEERIQQLAEDEICKYIANKITYVMNNGCANWFTQDNIKRITYTIVERMIDKEAIDLIIKSASNEEFVKSLSEKLSTVIADYLSN